MNSANDFPVVGLSADSAGVAPVLERLEDRLLMAASPIILTTYNAMYGIANGALALPVDGAYDTDGDGTADDFVTDITITATSNNPNIQVLRINENTRYAKLNFYKVTTPAGGTPGQRVAMGSILVQLYDGIDASTEAIERFVTLASDPTSDRDGEGVFYDDVWLHRIIDNFMIQMGDAQYGRDGAIVADKAGQGGSTLPNFSNPLAWNNLSFTGPGVLAFANAGADTNNSQFFITEEPTPWLEQKHPIFGQMISGKAVYDSIMSLANSTTTKVFLDDVEIIDRTAGGDQDATVMILPVDGYAGTGQITIRAEVDGQFVEKVVNVTALGDRPTITDLNIVHTPTPADGATSVVHEVFIAIEDDGGQPLQFSATETYPLSGASIAIAAMTADELAAHPGMTHKLTITVPATFQGFFKATVNAYERDFSWMSQMARSETFTVFSRNAGDPIGLGVVPMDDSGNGMVLDSKLVGDRMYVAYGFGGMKVFDVSDPANPVELDSVMLSYDVPDSETDLEPAAYAIHVDGSNVFVGGFYQYQDGMADHFLYSFSVDGAGQLTELDSLYTGWLALNLPQLTIRDGVAYIPSYFDGFVTVSVADPSHMEQLGIAATTALGQRYSQALSAALLDNYAYVADWGGAVTIFDVANPSYPRRVGQLRVSYPREVAIEGNRLYLLNATTAATGDLMVYDLSNPISPTLLGKTSVSGTPRQLTVRNGIVMLSTDNGAYAVNAANPADMGIDYRFEPMFSRGSPYTGQPNECRTRMVDILPGLLNVPTSYHGVAMLDAGDMFAIDLSVGSFSYTAGRYGPGSPLDFTLNLTNAGPANLAPGIPIGVEIRLSSDEVWGNADDIVLYSGEYTRGLASGAETVFRGGTRLPEGAVAGDYHVMARAIQQDAFNEIDLANQTFVSAAADVTVDPAVVPDTFGGLTTITYTDADGDKLTLRLTGPGTGVWDAATQSIYLYDTTALSSLSATVLKATGGDGLVDIGEVIVEGSLGSMLVRQLNITGDMSFSGILGMLQVNNLTGENTLFIRDEGLTGRALTLMLNVAEDYDVQSAAPIQTLIAKRWVNTNDTDDVIEAKTIAVAQFTGDHTQPAQVALSVALRATGVDATGVGIGTLITGVMDGADLYSVGGVRLVSARAWSNGTTQVGWFGTLLVSGDLTGTTLTATSQDNLGFSFGTLQAANVVDSTLTVPGGVRLINTGNWTGTGTINMGYATTVMIRGTLGTTLAVTGDDGRNVSIGTLLLGTVNVPATVDGEGNPVESTALDIAYGVRSITATEWTAGKLRAGWIGSLIVRGALNATVNATSYDGNTLMSIGTLMAGTIGNYKVDAYHAIRLLSVGEWADGELKAGRVDTMIVRGLLGADINVTSYNEPTKAAIGTLIAGSVGTIELKATNTSAHNKGGITMISVGSWEGGSIETKWIGTLISRGDFGAAVKVTKANDRGVAIGTFIAGNVGAVNLDVQQGSITMISVADWAGGVQQIHSVGTFIVRNTFGGVTIASGNDGRGATIGTFIAGKVQAADGVALSLSLADGVRLVSVGEWVNSGIKAEWIGTMIVRGAMGGTITADGQDSLGISVGTLIAGDVGAKTLNAPGHVRIISVASWAQGGLINIGSADTIIVRGELGSPVVASGSNAQGISVGTLIVGTVAPGAGVDAVVSLDGAVRLISVGAWNGGNLVADWVGTLISRGAYTGNITMQGKDAFRMAIGTLMTGSFTNTTITTPADAAIRLIRTGDWNGGGVTTGTDAYGTGIGTFLARDLTGVQVTTANTAAVNLVSVRNWVGGGLDAGKASTMIASGDLDGIDLQLRAADPNGRLNTVNLLSVTGWIRDTRVQSAGNVGTVIAGGLDRASLFAGAGALAVDSDADGVFDLPSSAQMEGLDDAAKARLTTLLVTGRSSDDQGRSVLQSTVAAWEIGGVDLVNSATDAGLTSGLAAGQLNRVAHRGTNPYSYTSWTRYSQGQPDLPGLTVNLV